MLFGSDTIHSVHNPLSTLTGAIHVYGGDLTTKLGRSEWDDETMAESPMDFDRTRALFEEANARYVTPADALGVNSRPWVGGGRWCRWRRRSS